ncbi:MAG: hypothetical protein ACJAS1_002479 [Oleiphilaceae bacterium]|jgi:hypothetical protein
MNKLYFLPLAITVLSFQALAGVEDPESSYSHTPFIEGKLDKTPVMPVTNTGKVKLVDDDSVLGRGRDILFDNAIPVIAPLWKVVKSSPSLTENVLLSWDEADKLKDVLSSANTNGKKITFDLDYPNKLLTVTTPEEIADNEMKVKALIVNKAQKERGAFKITEGSVRSNAERLLAHFGWKLHEWEASNYQINHSYSNDFKTLDEGLHHLLSPYSIKAMPIRATKSVLFRDKKPSLPQ